MANVLQLGVKGKTMKDIYLVWGVEAGRHDLPWHISTDERDFDGQFERWWLDVMCGVPVKGLSWRESDLLLVEHPCPFEAVWSGDLDWGEDVVYLASSKNTIDETGDILKVKLDCDPWEVREFYRVLEELNLGHVTPSWLMFASWDIVRGTF